MTLRLNILHGVTPVSLPALQRHVSPWKGPDNPPSNWYQTWSSMQYNIKPVGVGRYLLTPCVGRPVYTFDDLQEFILSTRDFTIALFDTPNHPVPMYRVHMGPPRTHYLQRYQPIWEEDQ